MADALDEAAVAGAQAFTTALDSAPDAGLRRRFGPDRSWPFRRHRVATGNQTTPLSTRSPSETVPR